MKTREEIIREMSKKYHGASKSEKGRIIESVVTTTGFNRNYTCRLLRTFSNKNNKKNKSRGRKSIYKDAFEALKFIWYIMGFPCGKNLKASMEDVIANLESHNHFHYGSVKALLLNMSPATIDRMLSGEKKDMNLKGRSHTKPNSLLKDKIRIKTFSEWDNLEIGFTQVDLVGHEGGNPSGEFLFTLNMTDVATQWTEPIAIENKSQESVLVAINKLIKRFPFKIKSINSDNGSEFINAHLANYCEKMKIEFTRSRQYKKNDNCYIEQKNNAVIRDTVGYLRYDTKEEFELINQLYTYVRLYVNHFKSSSKLIEKTREGSQITKKYDKPLTPYQRVMKYDFNKKEELRIEHEALDLFKIVKRINQLHDQLYKIQISKRKEA